MYILSPCLVQISNDAKERGIGDWQHYQAPKQILAQVAAASRKQLPPPPGTATPSAVSLIREKVSSYQGSVPIEVGLIGQREQFDKHSHLICLQESSSWLLVSSLSRCINPCRKQWNCLDLQDLHLATANLQGHSSSLACLLAHLQDPRLPLLSLCNNNPSKAGSNKVGLV